jgi:hypothetical protein
MSLTQQQKDLLKLIERSPDSGDGWRNCAPKIFEDFIVKMPDELVEKDLEQKRARFTVAGQAVVDWM